LQNYCPVCERVVQRSELVKGYQHEKDRYIIVDEEDLKAVRPESSSNLEIIQFTDIGEIDPIYFDRTYYLGPDRNSEKTFALLGKAMDETKKCAIGRLIMRNHEYLALVRPGMEGLVLHLMLYPDEVRENEYKIPDDVKLRDKELVLAKELIENLTESFEPEEFKSDYVEAVQEMLEAKIKGRKLTIVKPKAKPKVSDLMEALQLSVKQARMKRPSERAEEDKRAVASLKKIK